MSKFPRRTCDTMCVPALSINYVNHLGMLGPGQVAVCNVWCEINVPIKTQTLWLTGELEWWWLSIRMVSSEDKESLIMLSISWNLIWEKDHPLFETVGTPIPPQGGACSAATSDGRKRPLAGSHVCHGDLSNRSNIESKHTFGHMVDLQEFHWLFSRFWQ